MLFTSCVSQCLLHWADTPLLRRFLVRLLLVHGTLADYRLGRLIKYSFYKNITFAFMFLFFQPFNGVSGQVRVLHSLQAFQTCHTAVCRGNPASDKKDVACTTSQTVRCSLHHPGSTVSRRFKRIAQYMGRSC